MGGVVGIEESVRNVGHVIATRALASNVDLLSLGFKAINLILVESHELLCRLNFIHKVWRPLCKAGAQRLFHPEHVRQIHPAVGIRSRSEGAGLPEERPILGD